MNHSCFLDGPLVHVGGIELCPWQRSGVGCGALLGLAGPGLSNRGEGADTARLLRIAVFKLVLAVFKLEH